MLKINTFHKKKFLTLIFAFFILFFESCREPEPFPEEQIDERLSGGINTVFDQTSKAFSHQFPTMGGYNAYVHEIGDAQFEQTFVTAPAPVNSGLGPIFNNVSCSSCHHNDGIGVPTTGEDHSSLLIRISLPGQDAFGGPLAAPGYGTQIQDKAVFGKKPEAKVLISYSYKSYSFPDGETYELRYPTYTLTNFYKPINTYLTSPRLAPPVFGIGLLEAVPEEDIIALADPSDLNHDGISGKPNNVWDPVSNSFKLGRFGWKANVASVLAQVAGAYSQDMGVTNSVFNVESSFGQSETDDLKDDPEISEEILKAVTFYVQTLAVPARRNVTDPSVLRGKQIFKDAKCVNCHKETLTTGVNVALSQFSNQIIHPYTDLLLHDMGEKLADNRADFKADGSEWRTSPLWGLGLYETVNFPAYYLHDGRARTIIEAIMWHGGEAQSSVDYFENLTKNQRQDLLKFLKSL